MTRTVTLEIQFNESWPRETDALTAALTDHFGQTSAYDAKVVSVSEPAPEAAPAAVTEAATADSIAPPAG